jgi:hypothetical protein
MRIGIDVHSLMRIAVKCSLPDADCCQVFGFWAVLLSQRPSLNGIGGGVTETGKRSCEKSTALSRGPPLGRVARGSGIKAERLHPQASQAEQRIDCGHLASKRLCDLLDHAEKGIKFHWAPSLHILQH